MQDATRCNCNVSLQHEALRGLIVLISVLSSQQFVKNHPAEKTQVLACEVDGSLNYKDFVQPPLYILHRPWRLDAASFSDLSVCRPSLDLPKSSDRRRVIWNFP